MQKELRITLTVLIFIASFIIHIINLDAEGRTWDEQSKIEEGYRAIHNWAKGDFSQAAWWDGIEHPPITKYFYGIAVNTTVIDVDVTQPVSPDLANQINTGKYFYYRDKNNIAHFFSYDFTAPHLMSAFLNSLTVALVFLAATYFMALPAALIAAFVLMTTPRFIAMGRLATHESVSAFLTTLAAFVFYRLLEKHQQQKRWYIFAGIAAGLGIWSRYTNLYILVLFAGWWVIWHLYQKYKHKLHPHIPLKRNEHHNFKKELLNWRWVFIPVVAFLMGYVVWPFLWGSIPGSLIRAIQQHEGRGISPGIFQTQYLFLTTPVLYLLLWIAGMVTTVMKRKYEGFVLMYWSLSIMFFFLIFSSGLGGTRYIFAIYPAYAGLCGLGAYGIYELLKQKIPQYTKGITITGATLLVLYQLFVVLHWQPYYLDYYNELVGGAKGAVAHHLEFSWWGEGQREAGLWLENNGKPNTNLSLAVTPMYVFPPIMQNVKALPFNTEIGKTDYMVVSRGDLERVGKETLSHYKQVYAAEADGEPLVYVFEKK